MRLNQIFKALGEPVRLRLVSLLATSGEQCVCHLTEALLLPQSTVSRHLGVLRQAGLISARRDGKWMYYQLMDDTPTELITLLTRSSLTEVLLLQDAERLNRSCSC
ncbi:ArsR family transcriptional regulator [Mariprofundus aestuarium]|uniref:ArsR family transcriptional regulator n=1 Tax=Mariprofundus aestuarium TaxID=1921086 RepID=A0A2K8L178_MARES|nr:metalloregulator ArsR/SmtB family transcription factor [Mariprofundus aestuarium]ATX80832.1 ArsR family transcriptional regulator [Mariprofundus aestuarium]